MSNQDELDGLASRVIEMARDLGLTIATAESLTAGMTAAALGGVPGASAVLRGGAVTYCDEIKHAVLGVSEASLDRFSAVSEQIAAEMACGAAQRFGADLAVSLTGYAGPDGGTPRDPAGTVYIGLWAHGGCSVERCTFAGERNEVRRAAAARALEMLIETMQRA